MNKESTLNAVHQSAFDDEMQKIADGIFTPNYYLERYVDDIDKYHGGEMSFKELKEKVSPYVESRKESAKKYLEEQKLKSGRALTAPERAMEMGTRAVGGAATGAAVGGLVGRILKKGVGGKGAIIGGSLLAAEGLRQGIMKGRHAVYPSSKYKADLQKVDDVSAVTKRSIEDWRDPTADMFKKAGKIRKAIKRRRDERKQYDGGRAPRPIRARSAIGTLFQLSR